MLRVSRSSAPWTSCSPLPQIFRFAFASHACHVTLIFLQLLPKETVPTTRKADDAADRASVVVRACVSSQYRPVSHNCSPDHSNPCRSATCRRPAAAAGGVRRHSRPRMYDGLPVNSWLYLLEILGICGPLQDAPTLTTIFPTARCDMERCRAAHMP